jgi:UDP-N-acetylglucosamine--N-acetylmuramyl-(pentapeptide) pyrophosphoryl-undecaprenol N-acetylglucosamine transferase
MGTHAGIEAKLVPAANIDIDYISISGVRGKGAVGLLLAPFKITKAVIQAIGIVRMRKADAVLGMGGFAAGPGGVAAKILAKPLLIHEQNAIAGTTNKILSIMATQVLQAFPAAFAKKSHVQTVGNPVRPQLHLAPKATVANKKLNILVLGGSLGALAINEIMPEVLRTLSADIAIWHQAGARHIDSVKKLYSTVDTQQADYTLSAYIDDMAEAYTWADLVICRSGAMTVSELACASKPAIFIPFPFAIDDHQTANANWMVGAGAAMLLPQNEMNVNRLVEMISEFSKDTSRLQAMAEAAQQIAISDATQRVANYCEELAQ